MEMNNSKLYYKIQQQYTRLSINMHKIGQQYMHRIQIKYLN